jgi:beta-lactamase regulating signal transducer with metallopeptidase domain
MATLLLEVAVRATLVAAGTACVLLSLRVRTAAVRHAAWAMVVVAMLLLPVWSVAGPRIRLAVLPAGATSVDSGSGANLGPVNAAPRSSATRAERMPLEEAAPAFRRVGSLVLAGLYLCGVLALLVRLAIGTVEASRLRRGSVTRRGIATSARCATPVTVGWLSPVLILPEGWERWPAARLDAVVTHEGEHARRHDPLVQWLALLNRAVFWFHPLAWWLERRIANLAEEACDLAVIRAGHSPQDYSACLIDMAREIRRHGRRLDVLGMAMPGSNLAERMRRIFEESPMKPLTRTRVVCTLVLCAASSIVCAAGILAPATSVARGEQANGAAAAVERSQALSQSEAPGGGRTLPGIPQPSARPAQRDAVSASKAADQGPAGTSARSRGAIEPRRADSPRRARSDPAQAGMPDFSGHWLLVSATATGRGRGGSGATEGEHKTSSIWASGAPVNCGPECTITQNAGTFTIMRPGEPRYDNGVVVLNLDGSDSTLTTPRGSQYVFHAHREADKVVVTYDPGYGNGQLGVTQVLSIEGGKLKVVTSFHALDAAVTLTYAKQ